MALLLVIAAVTAFLFAFVDVWYFIRFFAMFIAGKMNRRQHQKITQKDLLKDHVSSSVVLPSDIDAFLHMNNAKYLREYDIARVKMAGELGFLDAVSSKKGAFLVAAATSIRYRRSMKLFQRFSVQSRLVYWEKDSFYLEQRTVTPDGFTTSILMTKYAVRGIEMKDVLAHSLSSSTALPTPPEVSPELSSWMESLRHSSNTLRTATSDKKTPEVTPTPLIKRSGSGRELGLTSLPR
ncbi:PREDICTED: protein THEM6-like [Amphimedon queenslandica]|uniref:Protein THEM6 n=1 Tax=Amphimedon queenslandica TaxID=400682 RepID=A0A1X7VQY1_AMPQE|nr:PREDICTED: protein THEM6-like [Amphimedon queenslandica]|eukprot:XP_011409543.1 PREDICTED: protein THEM6-like [Amphimedon queenslandica]